MSMPPLFPLPESAKRFDGLTSEKAVTIIRDISGPVDFSEGSVIFIMPTVLLAR